MFAAYGDLTDEATLNELYQNPQYAPYLAGMEMSINRAVARMQTLGLLPPVRVVLANPVVTGSVATFNLGGIEDFMAVERVMVQTQDAYIAHAYSWEGGTTLVVPLFSPDETYVLLYRPYLRPLDSLSSDEEELAVPDALARLIPFYVKSELYEEDDASASERARHYFEVGLQQWAAQQEAPTPRVAVKYAWEEL